MLTEALTSAQALHISNRIGEQANHQHRIAAPVQSACLDWNKIERVLLVRLRSIGDTVLMTACLDALKRWRPDLKISVVMEPLSAPILQQHPLVDNLLVVEKSTAARIRLLRRLRACGFDIAFNMHGGGTGSVLTALSGAATSFGYAGLSQAWMLSDRAPAPDLILGKAEIHSVEQQLALLAWSGVPFPEKPSLALSVSEQARIRICESLSSFFERTASREFALIAPAAAFESKRWSDSSFAAVASHLRNRWGLPSVIIAGPGQEQIARNVAAGAGTDSVALTGIGLQELIALSAMAAIFVGNDSGPMHIAAAMNRPIVATFGSSNPAVWHPWTEAPYRICRSPVISQIKTEEVVEAVDELLEADSRQSPGAACWVGE